MQELPIIQKTYDLIKWYIPILNRLPRDHRFALGERMTKGLYDLESRPVPVMQRCIRKSPEGQVAW